MITLLFYLWSMGKSKNRFALNNVYMIVLHLSPFFDRIRTTVFLHFYAFACVSSDFLSFLVVLIPDKTVHFLVWTSHSFWNGFDSIFLLLLCKTPMRFILAINLPYLIYYRLVRLPDRFIPIGLILSTPVFPYLSDVKLSRWSEINLT